MKKKLAGNRASIFINGYSTETGHQTDLYSTPQQHESTDNAVQYLVKPGIDPHQLVIGAAFYARVWEDVGETMEC